MKDLERSLLAAMFAWPDRVADVASELKPEHLSADAGAIYTAMLSLMKRGDPISLITVIGELKKLGLLERAGGAAELSRVTDEMPSVDMIRYAAREIKHQHRVGAMRVRLREADAKLISGDAPEDVAAWLLSTALREKSEREVRSAADIAEDVVKQVSEDRKADDVVRVDLLAPPLLPLHAGGTYVIAGATGTGKSALADQIVLAAARAGWQCCIMGLEMSAWERTARLLAHLSGVSISAILCRNLPPESIRKLIGAQDALEKLPVRVADCAGTNLEQIVAMVQREHIARGVKLVVVDYIQLVGVHRRGRSREQEVAEASRTLSQLAARLGIALIEVAQLSRLHLKERRPPDLHDLRDSGQIEQDADTVIMLAPVGDDGLGSPKRVAYIRKQRFGQVGRVPLMFDGARLTFRRADT